MRIRIPLFKYIIFSLINFVFISSLFASSEPTSIDVGQLGYANNESLTEELQTSKNNSSGFYFYKLIINNETIAIQKMILLK